MRPFLRFYIVCSLKESLLQCFLIILLPAILSVMLLIYDIFKLFYVLVIILYSIYLNICFLVFYYFFTLYFNFIYRLQIRKELPAVFGK